MTINPTTDAARASVQDLLAKARFAALAVSHPDTGRPYVSRVAIVADGSVVLMLISALSVHTKGLKADPYCALLIGEPGETGDPLIHPRITLSGVAEQVDKAVYKDQWLAAIPKSQLYFGFADFEMYCLRPEGIDLNAGFGKAFRLTPDDLSR